MLLNLQSFSLFLYWLEELSKKFWAWFFLWNYCGTVHCAGAERALHCSLMLLVGWYQFQNIFHESVFVMYLHCLLPSVLWRCRLGGRKGIRPVKTEWWCVLAWLSIWSEVQTCMAQLMPLPLTVSCFSKIQIGFTFLVPAHPGSPRQRAVEHVRVSHCLLITVLLVTFVTFSVVYLLVKPVVC